MKILYCLLLSFLSLSSYAQVLKNIKDRAANRAKEEGRAKVANAKANARERFMEEFKNLSAEFDSTDFDYAILLSDNAGLFAGKHKGESRAKFIKMGGMISSLLDNADLTDEENANLNLEAGQTSYAMGRFVFAEKRFRTARSYFEKAYLTEELGYLKTISGQGLLYTSMGRFTQAETFTSQALEIRKNKFGETNMGVAALLNNYGVLHYNLGRYNESEKEFDKAVTVILTNQQLETMAHAIVLNNQAMLFQSIGRYEEAVKKLQQAIDISGKLEASKAKNHLKFYSNLALLYQQMNKLAEAETIYKALENKLEKGKSEYANALNNAAILALLIGKHDRIEDMLKQSASIYKSNLGENSPALAKVISDLGNFYRYKGRYTDAEPLLEKALQIREQALGLIHPLYVQSQEDMALLQWKKGDWNKASLLYYDVMEKSLDFINNYFTPMSESEKAKYWDILSPRFQRFYNFAVEAAAVNNEIITELFEYRMAAKGLLLRSARKVSESILDGGNEQLIADYATWLDHKEQLSALYIYSKEELREQHINLDSLQAIANAMEKRLSENSKEFAKFYFTGKVKLAEVQNQLKDDEALVEIIRLRHFDQTLTDSSRYLVLVITKNNPQPKPISFPEGKEMESAFAAHYRISMKNRIADELSYTRYWAAIDPELKDKKKIYVSPDGIYNQISLYTLKKPDGGFLINQYDLALLGNPKDLMTRNSRSVSGKKATLFGYPVYGSEKIPGLPATKTEVEGVNKVLKSSGYQVNQYMQEDATEINLKQSKKNSVLHIATHGYFLQDVDRAVWPMGVHRDNARDNVLLRSGLMMAGASDADKLKSGLDNTSNGIITSYEAMNLDLNGTTLVVLSACETGLGEVKAGEGVYGLQRAFLAAGAEALIMSLWKVDDAATQQLMNSFYDNWIKTGDKQKAFKQAQLQLMIKYKEPYYWGAFVLMDD
jgi:CHAT domain-containing protein/tetratricopeptide (TPR) repeat protein